MNRNILIPKILLTASQRYTSQYWKQTRRPIVRSNIANDHFHSFVSWWPNLLSGQRTCFFHISCLPSVVRKSIFNFVFSLRMILYANISGYHWTQCLFQWISWHWMNVGFGHWDGRHTGGQSTHFLWYKSLSLRLVLMMVAIIEWCHCQCYQKMLLFCIYLIPTSVTIKTDVSAVGHSNTNEYVKPNP